MTVREPEPDVPAFLRGRGQGEEAMLSRPTETSTFGKCDERIDVPVPLPLREVLTTLAVLDGKSLATYVRAVLETHALHERERVRRIVQTYGGDDSGRNLP